MFNLGHATFYKIEVIHQPNSPTPRKLTRTESEIVAWTASNLHLFTGLEIGFVGWPPDCIQCKVWMAGVIGDVWVVSAFRDLKIQMSGSMMSQESAA